MPTPMIQAFAKESGKSIEDVERLWDKAKSIVWKKYSDKTDDAKYALTTAITKNMLGMKDEQITTTSANVGTGQSGQYAPKVLGMSQKEVDNINKELMKILKDQGID